MPRSFAIESRAIHEELSRVDGDRTKFEFERVVKLEPISFPPEGAHDVRVRILAVSVEHNVVHAALADPIDIAAMRGGKMFPGNSFVGEVLEVGSEVTAFAPGDLVLPGGNLDNDEYGYPRRAWAYDMPDSMGCYGDELMMPAAGLRPLPLDTGLNLWELASVPVRMATAHHLWRRGHDLFRVKVPREKLARMNVLAFGGGTSEILLMLAHSEGHRAFFCSGNAVRRAHMEGMGVETIDQLEFDRFSNPADVDGFRREVKARTDGRGMHLVCDMLRGPVFPAGMVATSRLGVNISAGWQLSAHVEYVSALASVRQVTLDHCHLETVDGCAATYELLRTFYRGGFRPAVHPEIFGFEELPRALQRLHRNTLNGIPVVRVARDLPEGAQALVP